jgi:hypothetical protein
MGTLPAHASFGIQHENATAALGMQQGNLISYLREHHRSQQHPGFAPPADQWKSG